MVVILDVNTKKKSLLREKEFNRRYQRSGANDYAEKQVGPSAGFKDSGSIGPLG